MSTSRTKSCLLFLAVVACATCSFASLRALFVSVYEPSSTESSVSEPRLDGNTPERRSASPAAAVLHAGARRPPDVHALLTEIAQGRVETRVQAARGLGSVADGRAVRALLRAIGDSSPEVRHAALTSLRRIGPEAHEATSALFAFEEASGDEAERGLALRAIGATGAGRLDVVDFLERSLMATPHVARAAAEGLILEGPEGLARLLALSEGKGDADAGPDMQDVFDHITLRPLSPEEAERLLPALSRLLEASSQACRRAALRSLEAAGPWARTATPALLRAADHAEGHERARTVEALSAVAPDTPEVVLALRRLAGDLDPGTRAAAERAVGAAPAQRR